MTLRFNFSGVVHGNACHDAPPVCEPCAPACCVPICGQCTPKVALRDHHLVKPRTAESCFTLHEGVCTTDVVHAARNCIEMHIRRRGECDTLLKLKALRATLEGAVCFSWPVEWWRLSDGYFEADIYVNGCTCLTVGLKMVGCNIALAAFSNVPGNGCDEGGLTCGVPQRLCVAPIDDTPVALPASKNCETCDA